MIDNIFIASHDKEMQSHTQKQVIKIATITMRETIQGSIRRDIQGYFSSSPVASQDTLLTVQLFYLKLNYMFPKQDSEIKLSLSLKGVNGS